MEGENAGRWAPPAARKASASAALATPSACEGEDSLEPFSGLSSANRIIGRADLAAALAGRKVYRVTALASADRTVGRRLDELRDLVRAEFRGTATCTHLNDALRSLADLSAMRALLG